MQKSGCHGWTLLISIGLLGSAACDSSTAPPPREAPIRLQIQAVTPTSLAGTVGTEVTPVPAVRATDGNSQPLAGIAVSFEVGNAGIIAYTSVTTDANGVAAVGRWMLGPAAGRQTVTMRSSGHADVIFTAMANAGPPAEMTRAGGNDQIAAVREPVVQPLLVKAVDAFGNPIVNAPVRFVVVAGGGSIENAVTTTDSQGIARSGSWTLGPEAGVQQVQAEVGNMRVLFSANAYAPLTGLRGQLAFVSGDAANAQIYSSNADGSLRTQLTSIGVNDAPAWSPDGSELAFASFRDSTTSIYVMNANGTSVTKRTNGLLYPGLAHELAWSPDGSAIAFTTLHEGNFKIATVTNTTDAAVTLLTRVPGYNSQPSWSPDGGQIAFVSDREAYDFVLNIYTMNADGSDQTLRTRGFGFWPDVPHYLHPAWSPDGTMIAFVHATIINASDMRFHVAIMSASGAFIKDLAWAGDIPRSDPLDPGSLAWEPDGSGIAYTFVDCDLVTAESCSRIRSVRYVSLDGSKRGVIAADAHSPTWRR